MFVSSREVRWSESDRATILNIKNLSRLSGKIYPDPTPDLEDRQE
jgi:hypothetical protein